MQAVERVLLKAVDKGELGGARAPPPPPPPPPPQININNFFKSAITCVMIAMSILIFSKENSEVPTTSGNKASLKWACKSQFQSPGFFFNERCMITRARMVQIKLWRIVLTCRLIRTGHVTNIRHELIRFRSEYMTFMQIYCSPPPPPPPPQSI